MLGQSDGPVSVAEIAARGRSFPLCVKLVLETGGKAGREARGSQAVLHIGRRRQKIDRSSGKRSFILTLESALPRNFPNFCTKCKALNRAVFSLCVGSLGHDRRQQLVPIGRATAES